MTANSSEESEALTLDINKLAKVGEVPGVLPCAAHIPHVPLLISAGFASLRGERCGYEGQHIGNYVPCGNTAEVLNSDLLNCAVPGGWISLGLGAPCDRFGISCVSVQAISGLTRNVSLG